MISYKTISQHLTDKQKFAVEKSLRGLLALWPLRPSLAVLALKYGTDKWTHGYIPAYETHFAPLRLKKMNVLEIGVGGYSNPKAGGQSLRMWKEYFENSFIYSIDIYDKKPQEEERIKIYQGSQSDGDFLRSVLKEIGSVDIIIDDGSHMNEHIVDSFLTLFPMLNNHGIYAIEDLQTSYMPEYGGSPDEHGPQTAIGTLKTLIDGLNYQWIPGRTPSYLDQNITALHWYPKLAFVIKGENSIR